jgi:hypothetical protein
MLEDALKGLRIARPARQYQSTLNAQDRIFSPLARLGCGATGALDHEGRKRLNPVCKGGSDVFVEDGTSLPEGQGVQEARFAALKQAREPACRANGISARISQGLCLIVARCEPISACLFSFPGGGGCRPTR